MKSILILLSLVLSLSTSAQVNELKFEVTVVDNYGNPLPHTGVYYYFPIPPEPGNPCLSYKNHFTSDAKGIARFKTFYFKEIIFGAEKSGRSTVTYTPTKDQDLSAIIPIKIICIKKE